MLAFIRGTVEEIGEDYIVLENGGMGYLIKVPGSVSQAIGGLHRQVTLHTYMHVREDEMSLFGFLSKDALSLFKLLITVNGVGPKVANSILTALDADQLRMAILSGDVKSITKANGIGTKGAQRIIMELKDKLDLEDMLEHSGDSVVSSDDDRVAEAAMALVSLGYSNMEALGAIKKVDNAEQMDVEVLIKAALKKLI